MAKLYVHIAREVDRVTRLSKGGYAQRPEDVRDQLDALLKDKLPSGSGFDAGSKLDWDRSTGERLVFTTEFHHMNDVGYYDGWTAHDVVVTPSLMWGFSLRVTGKDRNGIKDYTAEVFQAILDEDCGKD